MDSRIFNLVFYFGIIVISILFLPALILPKKITIFGGKIMGVWSNICLRFLLSTKIEIRGKENIIENENFFIACTHQSAFETFYHQVILMELKDRCQKSIHHNQFLHYRNKSSY